VVVSIPKQRGEKNVKYCYFTCFYVGVKEIVANSYFLKYRCDIA